MSDAERVRLYADLLWWFLLLLAAGGVPIMIGAIGAMVLRMRLINQVHNMPPPPPSFEEWLRRQRAQAKPPAPAARRAGRA